jgi:sulfofructose kinase
LSLGPRHAGVTLGSEGYSWREAGREDGRRGDGSDGHVPAFRLSVTDTTGAGDAFHGAFALMVAEGGAAPAWARIAAAVAALKCTRLGSRAGLPTRAELDAFLSSNPPA